MSKEWRPDGWENIHENILVMSLPGRPLEKVINRHDYILQSIAFEAGATAMLEALFKIAKESPTGIFEIDSKFVCAYHGGRVVADDEVQP
jgi:hypothetical protein